MLRIWKWYQSCLSLHPVKTQIISSGFLWGIGDVAAQYITHSTAKKRLQYHKVLVFFQSPKKPSFFLLSFSSCFYFFFSYAWLYLFELLGTLYSYFCFGIGCLHVLILCWFIVGYFDLWWWFLFGMYSHFIHIAVALLPPNPLLMFIAHLWLVAIGW